MNTGINQDSFSNRDRIVISICIVLLLPALLINLGLMTVIEDEAIRALVALEMWYSGDYIAPTINGQPYYNKPPLYNWIILLSYRLWGQVNEFSLRFPTVVFTLIYGALVFRLYRKDMGKLGAVIIALMTITCGRIFIYDSFLGLIDMCFSMCMFSLMIGSYHLARKEAWTKMFLFAYALAAIGFMLKTLPAIVFLGLSLLVICISLKQFKQFFRLGHFLGIGVFILIVGSYYFVYSLEHDIIALFTKMLTESSDRTVVKFGIEKTIKHLFTFPFELIYHFLPWTIMIIYLMRKSAYNLLWDNDFLRMNILLLVVNILLYWTSPQVYARYLLMFPPLMFAPLYYLHRENEKDNTIHYKIVKGLLLLLMAAICIGIISLFFVDRISFVPHRYLKAGILAVLATIGVFFLYTSNRFRLLYVFVIVIVFRIGFNWFVLEDRNATEQPGKVRISTLDAADKFGQEMLFCTPEGIPRTTSYYISRETKRIIHTSSALPDGLLITTFPRESCKKIGDIKSRNPKVNYLVLDCKQ